MLSDILSFVCWTVLKIKVHIIIEICTFVQIICFGSAGVTYYVQCPPAGVGAGRSIGRQILPESFSEGFKWSKGGINNRISFLRKSYVCVLNDQEEAGYFYHDLMQLTNSQDIFFFPQHLACHQLRTPRSGQRDFCVPRCCRLQMPICPPVIVTYPDALAEKGVAQADLKQKNFGSGGRQAGQYVCLGYIGRIWIRNRWIT